MIVPPFGKYPSLELQPWMYNEQYTFVRYVLAFCTQGQKRAQTDPGVYCAEGQGEVDSRMWILSGVPKPLHKLILDAKNSSKSNLK